MIPKTIHYCWFGKKEKPPIVKRCIKSWKTHCPGYAIIEWNEDNIDFDLHPNISHFYKEKIWSFVSDYIRSYVLYTHGGIYLDTDMEVIKPLDDLLLSNNFFGYEDKHNKKIGSAICGCIPHDIIMCRIWERFKNGKFEIAPVIFNEIVKKCNDSCVTIYPYTYFFPLPWPIVEKYTEKRKEKEKNKFLKEETYTFHWFLHSWFWSEKSPRKTIRRELVFLKKGVFELTKKITDKKSEIKWLMDFPGEILYLLSSLIISRKLPEKFRRRFPVGIIKIYDYFKLEHIARNVEHIFGKKEIHYGLQEAIVLCLVKDGGGWINEFIEHYFTKGFKHIVFLDNCSTDNTVDLAKKYSNITILKTDIPFKDNNLLLRRYLVKRFGKNRWSLTVDIDELWDYPFSDVVKLGDLLEYLRGEEINAVIAQMLDMFTTKIPIKKTPLSQYDYYDISAIQKNEFNVDDGFKAHGFTFTRDFNKKIKFFKGGVRASFFGLNDVWLTKMPLLFYDATLMPLSHQHFSNNAKIADITSVIFHYKLTHALRNQVKNAVKTGQYSYDSYEYKKYDELLEKDDEPNFKQESMKKFTSVKKLVDEDFLVVSNSYLNMVESLSQS